MKVLLNALQAGNRSGTGRYTEELARRLPQLSSDLEVIVLWPGDVALPKDCAEDAFIVAPVERGSGRIIHEQCRMNRERRRLKADLVHYPANIGNFTLMRKTILTIHDLGFIRNPSWSTYQRAAYHRITVHRSATLARRVIADSQATAKDVNELLGIPANRIDVVHLGVDQSFARADIHAQTKVRGIHNLPPRFFLFVSTLEPRKNVPRLVDAYSSIAAQCEEDLVIAGRTGWKAAPIFEAIGRSPVRDRIHVRDYVEERDLAPLLSAATAFVWPSLWEGFGLPLLEAMACGTAVLTSARSSMPEVVGDDALLVDPYDVQDIAAGMLRLAKDEKLRHRLSEGGLDRAARFTWQRTAELTLESYRAALERP